MCGGGGWGCWVGMHFSKTNKKDYYLNGRKDASESKMFQCMNCKKTTNMTNK